MYVLGSRYMSTFSKIYKACEAGVILTNLFIIVVSNTLICIMY